MTKRSPCRFCGFHSSRGFSLIEVAIVMMIMGSLLSGLLVALSKTTNNNRISAAKNQLARIEEALYGFAQANGRLPCPASSASAGLEVLVGGVGSDCTQTHGFVPNATLSLYGQTNDDGLMRDPWANPFRYSVSDLTMNGAGESGERAFTGSNGLNDLFSNLGELAAPTVGNLVRVCNTSACATPLTSVAPAVVFSMGENWVTTTTLCNLVQNPAVNIDEHTNSGASLDGVYCLSNPANMDFVSRTYVEDVFDDVVIWLSPHVLFGKLISANQLP